jgi:hypothetical protein
MIERALAVQVDGEVKVDYADGGVVCTIDAPLAAVAEGDLCPRAEASKRGALQWRPASEDAFEAGC